MVSDGSGGGRQGRGEAQSADFQNLLLISVEQNWWAEMLVLFTFKNQKEIKPKAYLELLKRVSFAT